MPASDLELLIEAAKLAGEAAVPYWRNAPETWEKDANAGPVTEADLAANDVIRSHLMTARPDYGWLSEESPDSTARLSHERVFIIDPIDGTRSFIAGEKTWSHSLAVAQKGQITAAVIFLPLRERLFSAAIGQRAFLNGKQISASGQRDITGADVLSTRPNFEPRHWRGTPPDMKRHFRASLAYRMALVAQGRFDAMLTLRNTWEWDVAAGTLIATEAGAQVSDRTGQSPVFNNPKPALNGLIAAPHPLHSAIINALAP